MYGIRKIHHAVEVRVPFELDIQERGNVDVDMEHDRRWASGKCNRSARREARWSMPKITW
jgi:hypothetical protein